jgi:hypothetical protein
MKQVRPQYCFQVDAIVRHLLLIEVRLARQKLQQVPLAWQFENVNS